MRTLLLAFDSVRAAADTVGAVIAAGIVPAAMEVMDQRITIAVEAFVHAGYPTDAAAVLLAEVDGLEAGTTIEADRIAGIGRAHGATSIRVGGHRDRTGTPLEGPQDGVRCGRPDRAVLLPP